MKIINNPERLNHYIKHYEVADKIGEDILSHGQLHFYKKDEIILEADAPLIYYYLIVDGSVRISYWFENGKSILLKMYHAFNGLGDIELFSNTDVRSDVLAAEDTYLIALSADIIRQHYRENPKFLHFIIESLSDKLSATMNNSAYNMTYPLKNRLSSFLMALSKGQKSIDLTMSYQEIAQFLGATYRHLNRTFKDLEEEGLIICKDKHIEIIDMDALEEYSREAFQKFL